MNRDDLIRAIARGIAAREAKPASGEVRFLCPAHDDHRPSARWHPQKQTWCCDSCGAGGGYVDLARIFGLLPANGYRRSAKPANPAKVAIPRKDFEEPVAKVVANLPLKLWADSAPAEGTLAEKYLRSRGISTPVPPTLRFSNLLKHNPSGRSIPAMVAAVTVWPSRDVVAVHRTYLKPDGSGKADVEPQKMMLGPVRGGAVRLAPLAGGKLIIAEGIETALSVMMAMDLPAWAVLSAVNYVGVILPPDVEVLIAADPDDVGVGKAREAADQWCRDGRKVEIVIPDGDGDFNDVLRGVA